MYLQPGLTASHICSWLSVQSTHALLCLGIWTEMGYMKDKDVKAATVLPEVDLDDENELV